MQIHDQMFGYASSVVFCIAGAIAPTAKLASIRYHTIAKGPMRGGRHRRQVVCQRRAFGDRRRPFGGYCADHFYSSSPLVSAELVCDSSSGRHLIPNVRPCPQRCHVTSWQMPGSRRSRFESTRELRRIDRRLAKACSQLYLVGEMRLRTLLESREGSNTSPKSIALPAVANPYALIRRAAVTLL
jgi:hypothetical protein